MFNGTFLKPSTIDLLYRGMMYANGVVNFSLSFSLLIFFSTLFSSCVYTNYIFTDMASRAICPKIACLV